MSTSIVLEDGRTLNGSNLGISGMLFLISEFIRPSARDLQVWLADVADRTGGFMGFDLRGLSEEHRIEFWLAAQKAEQFLELKFGPEYAERPQSYAANCLKRLLKMHTSILAAEPPSTLNDHTETLPFNGELIDVKDLWNE